VSSRVTYLTRHRAKPFEFQGTEFVPVLLPAILRKRSDDGGEVIEERREGLAVRVTNHERTLVDVLHSPQHAGSWEEIWRSLESIDFVDLDSVAEYALRLESGITVARVGFFLEQHREELFVEDRHLEALRARAPARPTYFDRRRRSGGKLLQAWNLIVPEEVLTREWGEVA
jgi:predicted transcriptional regulator of viral defense system